MTPSRTAFVLYFLRLGALGFGGPIALTGAMQRDLVEERGWVSKQDFLDGLALAQLAPGPLAAQLAIYLGWVHARLLGATLVAAAFILPSFVMVLALSALYVRYGGLPWMQGVFYGVGPAAIALIARGALKLARMTLGRDALLWTLFAINALVTAWTGQEVLWVFVSSGLVVLALRSRAARRSPALGLAPFVGGLMTGLAGPAGGATLVQLAVYFAGAGTLVFGSGLAIVPFLHGGVVQGYHWLDERQFLDAVAVAMITPGPVVITVAFIGFLVAGPAGATAAAIGVFLPCYLLVVLPAPYYRRFAGNASLRHFVAGVTAAAAGAIAGAAFLLGRRAIVDVPSALIGAAALAVIMATRRIPEPIVILVAGGVGLLLRAA
ncbi:MAG TPA: chromate efflux transporter [Candidatus Eisenbacteria bacterium]|nr:chromate efflux transporter [Candidatus Eisenbacteria bacterium]